MPPVEEVYAENLQLKQEMAALRAENAWLKREVFGPGKSEKLDRLQTSLPLDVAVKPLPEKLETIQYERVAAPREKRPIPAEVFKDVPVKETVVIEPEEVKANPEAFEKIGEERTFEIDVVSQPFFSKRHSRCPLDSLKRSMSNPSREISYLYLGEHRYI